MGVKGNCSKTVPHSNFRGGCRFCHVHPKYLSAQEVPDPSAREWRGRWGRRQWGRQSGGGGRGVPALDQRGRRQEVRHAQGGILGTTRGMILSSLRSAPELTLENLSIKTLRNHNLDKFIKREHVL